MIAEKSKIRIFTLLQQVLHCLNSSFSLSITLGEVKTTSHVLKPICTCKVRKLCWGVFGPLSLLTVYKIPCLSNIDCSADIMDTEVVLCSSSISRKCENNQQQRCSSSLQGQISLFQQITKGYWEAEYWWEVHVLSWLSTLLALLNHLSHLLGSLGTPHCCMESSIALLLMTLMNLLKNSILKNFRDHNTIVVKNDVIVGWE